MDSKAGSAIAAMTFSAAIWGFIGMYTRNLASEGFTAMQTAFLRMLIGAVILAVLLAVFDRTSFAIKRRDVWLFVFIGAIRIVSDFFLFEAQIRIHLSLSTVLQMTSPYWVLLFCMILFSEAITARKVFAICMAFVGCILVTGVLSEDVDFDLLGISFAALAGVTFAGYTVGNKLLMNRGYSGNTVILYVFLTAALVSLPFSDVVSIPGKVVSNQVIMDILGMGILMSLIPYYLQVYSLKYLSPVTANLIGILEVPSAVIVGYVIYGESLGLLNFIGMALIPLSIVVMNLDIRRMRMERLAKKAGKL